MRNMRRGAGARNVGWAGSFVWALGATALPGCGSTERAPREGGWTSRGGGVPSAWADPSAPSLRAGDERGDVARASGFKNDWGTDGTGPTQGFAPAPRQASGLKGGELDDNDRWDEYRRYRDRVATRVSGRVQAIDVTERLMVRVVDRDGLPAAGARLDLVGAQGERLATRTAYADGRALFFPRAEGRGVETFSVEASLGSGRARVLVARGEPCELRLDAPREERPDGRPGLDVVFCLDCTGSMGDEIGRLKATLDSVARRLGDLPGRPRVRFGLVRFRDRGDEFVVRHDGITADLESFRERLARAEAAGGGDTPEDVQAGLAAAVDDTAWDASPGTARLVFLVGDAAPHLYPDEPSYASTLRRAAERGIKCVPVAASGLDDVGEYVWRQLAQTTLSRFVFLSYATSDGGRGTPHHTGAYLENDLDEVVVRQCAREVDALVAGRDPLAPRQTWGRGQE